MSREDHPPPTGFRALLQKDVRREVLTREAIQAAFVVVLLFGIAFLFAYPRLDDDPRAAGLLLWLPLLFGGVTSAGRAFALEADAGVLPLLRQAPVPLGMHGVVRTLLQAALTLVLASAVLAVGAVGWDVPASGPVLAVLAMAALGIATVGTLAGALAAQARVRDLLLPVLAVPVLIPLLQAGIPATLDALAGSGWGEVRPALAAMAGYDVIAAGAAWLLWPHALEAD